MTGKNLILSIDVLSLFCMLRWWKDLKLAEKVNFFRDRTVENALWIIGMIFEPQHSCCRIMEFKIFNLYTLLDDTYDVFGTLDELELFTAAFERYVDISQALLILIVTLILGWQ